jgi:hypothetical protein
MGKALVFVLTLFNVLFEQAPPRPIAVPRGTVCDYQKFDRAHQRPGGVWSDSAGARLHTPKLSNESSGAHQARIKALTMNAEACAKIRPRRLSNLAEESTVRISPGLIDVQTSSAV